MSNLFNISGELIALRNQIEGESEFAEESAELQLLEEKLAIKQEELSTKVEGYIHVIAQADAQANMGITELKRVQAFIDQKQHVADRLRAALLQALLLFGEEDKNGVKRLTIGTHRLSTRRSTSTKVLDESAVTDDCKKVDVTFKNLTPEVAKFLSNRLRDLPESDTKPILIEAHKATEKISLTEVKAKMESEEIDWATTDTKYNITIK